MALSRVRTYVRGKFLHTDLEASLNNIKNYINNFLVQNPITSNLNFGSFDAINFSSKQLANIVIASEYTTLNDAVSALPSTGGVIYLPPGKGSGAGGKYEVTTGMTLVANTTIIGGGWNSIVKLTADPGATLFEASNISNVMFANFQIDGGNKHDGNEAGISVFGSTECILQNLRIKDIGDVFSAGGHDGILLDSADRVWVSKCYVTGCGRHGIVHGGAGSSGTNIIVTENVCTSNLHSGIDFEPAVNNTVIIGNICDSNGGGGIYVGMEAETVNSVIITNNSCKGNGDSGTSNAFGVGINFTSSGNAGNVTTLLISENNVSDCNDASGNSGQGIQVEINDGGTYQNIKVVDNQIEDTEREGVLVSCGNNASVIDNLDVSRNTIHNSNRAGTSTEDALKIGRANTPTVKRISVRDNVIFVATDGSTGAPNYGIEVDLEDGTTGVIDGNFVDVEGTNALASILVGNAELVLGTNYCDSAIYNL